jgi:hypothetical protein
MNRFCYSSMQLVYFSKPIESVDRRARFRLALQPHFATQAVSDQRGTFGGPAWQQLTLLPRASSYRRDQ